MNAKRIDCFFRTVMTEKIIMTRIEPSEALILSDKLREFGINTACPANQKRIFLQLYTLHPEEIIWPIPIIEFRTTGNRAHFCENAKDASTSSKSFCKCQYFPTDHKYLIVSREAQELFGYSERECIELCNPNIPEDEIFTDPPILASLIFHEDWNLVCQCFVEAVLDSEGRSSPKAVRCLKKPSSSSTQIEFTKCMVCLRFSRSDNYVTSTWNHIANWCFIPL
jgi:hypothetical protein